LIGVASLMTAPVFAQNQPAKVNILKGPATAKLGAVAQINLPAGFDFLDGATTRAMMKAYGEPVSGNELGLIEATNGHWSVIFEFSDIGYVKDDDKNKLDADKLLASFKAGTAEQNKQRVANGRAPLEIIGWEQPPHYDDVSHNLTWAIRCSSEGRQILNYNTRLLGRLGVMEVVLICEPDQLSETLPTFTGLLAGYSFQADQNYAAYRQGDKVAKYGLAALVLGGAAVGAAKLGMLGWLLPFLKKGWILIVAALAGLANFFRKLFGKATGRKDDDGRPT
jgi:uncharacterized membrane-anchored protein